MKRSTSVFLASIAVCILAGALGTVQPARAIPVSFGTAGPDQWAVLGIDSTDIAVGSSTVTGVTGNVGCAPTGDLHIVKSTVSGNVIMNTAGNLAISADSFIGGFVQQDAAADAILNQAVSDARTASFSAAALAPTGALSVVDNSTIMIVGGPGINVYQLTDFSLTNGFNLTLSAPAGGQFVFNIPPPGTLHMADGSEVILSGGLEPSQVMYNVTGPGKQVDVIKVMTTLRGLLVATERDVKIDQAKVVGEVIAGGSKMTDNSRGAVDGSGCSDCPTRTVTATSWGRLKLAYH